MTTSPAEPAANTRCPDCGKAKACYESRAAALAAAAQHRRRRTSRAYRCVRFWHLTRWSSEAYRERATGAQS